MTKPLLDSIAPPSLREDRFTFQLERPDNVAWARSRGVCISTNTRTRSLRSWKQTRNKSS